MDVLLKNGDLALRRDGAPMLAQGRRALLQRALIRLQTRRGSLPHDPAFGSELRSPRGAGNRKALETRALAMVREALAPIAGLEVLGLSCAYDPEYSRLTLSLRLATEGREAKLEVPL